MPRATESAKRPARKAAKTKTAAKKAPRRVVVGPAEPSVRRQLETIDLPLILVAQGSSADAAIGKVLELEEATVLPPATAKKVAGRGA